MLTFTNEEDQQKFVDAVDKYEAFFKCVLPFAVYINGEVTDDKLNKFISLIDDSIASNKPLDVPEDYSDRIY